MIWSARRGGAGRSGRRAVRHASEGRAQARSVGAEALEERVRGGLVQVYLRRVVGLGRDPVPEPGHFTDDGLGVYDLALVMGLEVGQLFAQHLEALGIDPVARGEVIQHWEPGFLRSQVASRAHDFILS